mgnify:CR=1 FL=1
MQHATQRTNKRMPNPFLPDANATAHHNKKRRHPEQHRNHQPQQQDTRRSRENPFLNNRPTPHPHPHHNNNHNHNHNHTHTSFNSFSNLEPVVQTQPQQPQPLNGSQLRKITNHNIRTQPALENRLDPNLDNTCSQHYSKLGFDLSAIPARFSDEL